MGEPVDDRCLCRSNSEDDATGEVANPRFEVALGMQSDSGARTMQLCVTLGGE